MPRYFVELTGFSNCLKKFFHTFFEMIFKNVLKYFWGVLKCVPGYYRAMSSAKLTISRWSVPHCGNKIGSWIFQVLGTLFLRNDLIRVVSWTYPCLCSFYNILAIWSIEGVFFFWWNEFLQIFLQVWPMKFCHRTQLFLIQVILLFLDLVGIDFQGAPLFLFGSFLVVSRPVAVDLLVRVPLLWVFSEILLLTKDNILWKSPLSNISQNE